MDLLKLLPAPQPAIVRYGITILLVLLMFGLKLGLRGGTGLYAFILYVPAIVAAALLFDRGSGFLAVGVSSIIVAFTVPWTEEKIVDHVTAISTFVIIGSALALISEGLRHALEKADAAAAAQEVLLHEMSHRVKNKFTMISSVIALQARTASPETRAALEAVSSRVRTMAQVHDYLQISRNPNGMVMDEYLAKLCASLADALSHLRPITVDVTVVQIVMPPDKALSVGLIVNELVTNAFKYAFPDDRPGVIRVTLARESDVLLLTVADNGIGPGDTSSPGLGTRLVEILAAQIGGTCHREVGPGLSVTVTFPSPRAQTKL
jgi:two-component sensor histidine kinase